MVPNVAKLLLATPYGDPLKAHYEVTDGIRELHIVDAPQYTEIKPQDLMLQGVKGMITLFTPDGDIMYDIKGYDAERCTFQCKKVYDHTTE